MITILSKKKFRFPVPGSKLMDGQNAKQQDFSKLYFETNPGPDPQEAPDWIKNDPMWRTATADGDLFEVTVQKVKPSQKDLAVQAAVNQAGTVGETKPLDHSDLESMTKAQLMEHAASEHDLELPQSAKKEELVAAIIEKREEAAAEKKA